MFDFNLKIGDSIGNRFMFRVKDRKKIKLNSDSLIQITLENKTLPNYPDLVWIESIGCLNNSHPIDWIRSYGLLDYDVKLNCLLKDNENLLNQFGKTCLEHDLLNPNKKWHIWSSNNSGDLKYSDRYYFTNRDTTLFGKKYQTMNQINRFVRYDSLASKYFILSNYNNGQELLVYSDKAKVGDTMAIIYGTTPDKVTKIEYKWIEDDYRKIVTTGWDVYISGIGSINRVMWKNHLATVPEYLDGNVCFEVNSVIRYHYPFFYQNKEQCEITSSIQNAYIKSISFFPNPVQTSLNFNTSDKKEFKIRNSLGVMVLEGECEEKIDLATLPKGIYFIELQAKNQTSHFKFLKE